MPPGPLPPLDAGYMARAMARAPAAPDIDGAARFATALFLGGIERMGLDFKRT